MYEGVSQRNDTRKNLLLQDVAYGVVPSNDFGMLRLRIEPVTSRSS